MFERVKGLAKTSLYTQRWRHGLMLTLLLFVCVSTSAFGQSEGWTGTALQFASADSTYAGPAVALAVLSESGNPLGSGTMREDGTFDIAFDSNQVTAALKPLSEICVGTDAVGQLLLTTVATVSDISSGEAYGQLQASSSGTVLFHVYSPESLSLKASCADGSSLDLTLSGGWNLAELTAQAGSPGLVSLPSSASVQWIFFPNELWMSRYLP